ncbi:DNA polymerase IV [Halonotius roseus]|uniref:DNA polymerase IV n=1 Tax=Halonotius roseus TaxID=2511997 RepID=A0A544QL68_9EURY|nr:DNA polymerase IV [Halonotius roseus]TQQ79093.1 DNA polymerase IV [Halonotius roseus]
MTFAEFTDTASDDDPRIILHVDMDCFYASCERLREPALRGEPLVVGMGYEAGEPHGAVATASYEAREYGIDSAQPISQALDSLPRAAETDAEPAGYYRPVDLDFYEEVASDVKAILHDCADVVREVSIDEAYLDVTDRTSWGVVDADGSEDRTIAEGYARYIKQRIDREVGVPASVGVAPNMATAKVASDHDKPDGLTVVRPSEVTDFLAPLPVAAIHGVGPVTERELAELGIDTAGDLAAADPTDLADRFGERGRELYARARGDDDREVTPTGRPKSLSRESAFTEATEETEAKRERVSALAADVAARARSRDAMYQTVGIKVVTPPFDVNTRATSLSGPIDEPDLVESIALDLLDEFDDDPVRKLGVRVSKLSFGAQDQARLDGFDATPATDSEDDDRTEWENTADIAREAVDTDAQLTDWVDDDGDRADDDDESDNHTAEGQSSLGRYD